MRRYWRIYRTFFVSSLVRELEFRANFMAQVAREFVWVGFVLLILLVIYRNADSIAGWSRGDTFVLAASTFQISAITAMFFTSLMEIPQHVRLGTLDFIVTKPSDSQFTVSTRKFNFSQSGTFVAGVCMIVLGMRFANLHPSLAQWGAYVALMACSLAMYYSFILFLMTTGIWLVRVDNLWVLAEGVMQVARYPIDIYQARLRNFLTFGVPLAFISSVPSRQLVRGVDPGMIGIGLAWAVGGLVLSRLFWVYAMRNYTSASS
ncbi:MAG: ABC-2 family transporter protein [Fimbriimonas ginsengisoli]|nr:ABC-2 family transporter protein [Fimbriimonas ginsengisoli]